MVAFSEVLAAEKLAVGLPEFCVMLRWPYEYGSNPAACCDAKSSKRVLVVRRNERTDFMT
jgi:hypothetical protein